MGQRDRERIAQIKQGMLKPFRNTVIKLAARGGVIRELSKGTTTEQIGKLDELGTVGALPNSKLRKAIMDKAPKEMDKAIRKYQKEGKKITVDSLLVEVRSQRGFLDMCNKVGITYKWFEDLARTKMETHGITS